VLLVVVPVLPVPVLPVVVMGMVVMGLVLTAVVAAIVLVVVLMGIRGRTMIERVMSTFLISGPLPTSGRPGVGAECCTHVDAPSRSTRTIDDTNDISLTFEMQSQI
jgi:hypothetical protein